jgi:hypothetical protein
MRRDLRTLYKLLREAFLTWWRGPQFPLPLTAESQGNKVLLAVITCHKRKSFADYQRTTWAKGINSADVRFFVGRGQSEPRADEIRLDVPDDYAHLKEKVRAACRWAISNGYEYFFKTDDDVVLHPDEILASGFENENYIGRAVPLDGLGKVFAAGGSGYWLSLRAMRYVAFAIPENSETVEEDRWVAEVLRNHGIRLHSDQRYTDEANASENPISYVDHSWKKSQEEPVSLHWPPPVEPQKHEPPAKVESALMVPVQLDGKPINYPIQFRNPVLKRKRNEQESELEYELQCAADGR